MRKDSTADDVLTPRVLREYALVADGERGALIGPDGSVAWLCAPRWDSPAAFSGLLGGAGRYTVTPADRWHVWGGYYESGTLIWRSRWVSDWKTECREALAMPADPHRAVLLRRVEALDGPARITAFLDLRAGFGRGRMADLKREQGEPGGVWTGHSGALRFRWTGAGQARPADGGLAVTLRLAPGEHHDLVLEISDRELPDERPDPDLLWAATEEAWSQVAPDCGDLIAVADARHAYAVLRGLTSASGAMVAAATTSLPERLEASRNYDYRYAWIRDQCYAGLALAAHGPHPMLASSVRFVTERLHGRRAADDARVHGGGQADPGRAARAAARLPRRGAAQRQLGAGTAAAGCVRRGAVAAGRRGRARHARRRGVARGRGSSRCDRAALAGAGCRHLGTGQPALGALADGLRVWAARGR